VQSSSETLRRQSSTIRFQTKTGPGTPPVKSIVAVQSRSSTHKSRQKNTNIQSQHPLTEPACSRVPKARSKDYNSTPGEATAQPPSTYPYLQSNQPIFPPSPRGIPESKPLPPHPKPPRPELPREKRSHKILTTDGAERLPSIPDPSNAITVPTLLATKHQMNGNHTHKLVDTADALPIKLTTISQIPPPNSRDKDFPQSIREARDHITAIRNSKIEKWCEDLENALDM
jgi:hypothetical protein